MTPAINGVVSLENVVERVCVKYAYGVNPSRYAEGVKSAGEFDCIKIALNNTWAGEAGNSVCYSYEKVGYHNGSVDFIRGALDAGCPVYAYYADGWRKVA